MFFPADPGSVRPARRWAAESARARGASPGAERVVTLLASELVSNAVKYGPPDGTIVVEAPQVEGVVRVEVSDEGAELPVVLHPGPEATGGRGMCLVEMLSTAWGVTPCAGGGKTVWFEVDAATCWPDGPATA